MGRPTYQRHNKQGVVFFHIMPKTDFSVVLVCKNTCHGYINNHKSPFIGPIKIEWNVLITIVIVGEKIY